MSRPPNPRCKTRQAAAWLAEAPHIQVREACELYGCSRTGVVKAWHMMFPDWQIDDREALSSHRLTVRKLVDEAESMLAKMAGTRYEAAARAYLAAQMSAARKVWI